MDWLSVWYRVAMDWLWAIYWLAIGWLWDGYRLAIAQNQLEGYGPNQSTSRQSYTMYQSGMWLQSILWTVLCSQVFLIIGWLCPKINILQDMLYTTMYQCGTWLLSILWPVVCSQDFLATGWLLAGYRLAIGYVLKSIHFKTQSYATMYQRGTWLLSILWTAVYSQDFLAIIWLLAGYVPTSIHFNA